MNSRKIDVMPRATWGRRSSRNTFPLPLRRRGGSDGMLIHCPTSASRASGTTKKKAPRQPIRSPRKLPSGAEIVAAMALPAFSIARPLGTASSGRSRMTIAVDIDQKPPIATPRRARPSISAA